MGKANGRCRRGDGDILSRTFGPNVLTIRKGSVVKLIKVLSVLSLSFVLSTSLAFAYYYGGVAPEASNRLVAAAWGVTLGLPAAIAIVLRIGNKGYDKYE